MKGAYVIKCLAQEMERFNRTVFDYIIIEDDTELSEEEKQKVVRLLWRYECYKNYEEEFAGTDLLKRHYPAL